MANDSLGTIEYRDEPAILVFGDSEAAVEAASRIARLAGCRVAGAALTAEAADRLDRHAAACPILVELGEPEESGAVAPLLDRLREEALTRGRRSVVVAPRALIDLVAARAWDGHIVHLCEPDEVQRVGALVTATRRQPLRLHDVGREGNALLQQLSEEVGRIANILASLSEEEAELGAPKALGAREADEPPLDAATVRALIRARRLRDQYFRGDLFADPAWDMLLDLMAARIEGNRVAVSSLCIAAAVPATTALRWIKALTDRGLFVRSADPEDGRRVYIALSDETARTLAAYLRAVQRIGPAVI
ncbi:MAG TPA: winged helix DNA-binding protein [Allosphingosinicella sp.]|nr:winged helix DNA-binding protein [Allosphingosinicella sp.]